MSDPNDDFHVEPPAPVEPEREPIPVWAYMVAAAICLPLLWWLRGQDTNWINDIWHGWIEALF